jgi:fatty-acyl-CoA synthase
VDRHGDTFRWKGENVATSEIAQAMTAFPTISEANVYGVSIPGTEGRAGMAAIVLEGELDLGALRSHLVGRLPPYARPVFLRIQDAMEVTTTYKHTKAVLAAAGYDPTRIKDRLYFDHPARQAYVPLDPMLFDDIQSRRIRI